MKINSDKNSINQEISRELKLPQNHTLISCFLRPSPNVHCTHTDPSDTVGLVGQYFFPIIFAAPIWTKCFALTGAFQGGRRDQSHALMIKNITCVCDSALDIICLHATTQVFFDLGTFPTSWLCCSFFVRAWNEWDESMLLLTGATPFRLPSTFFVVRRFLEGVESRGVADVKPPGSNHSRVVESIELVHKTNQIQSSGPPTSRLNY